MLYFINLNIVLRIFLGEHAPEILRHWLEMPPNYTSLNPVFQNVLGKHFSQLIIWILKAAILHHFESYANFYGRACPKFPRHWFECHQITLNFLGEPSSQLYVNYKGWYIPSFWILFYKFFWESMPPEFLRH